MDISFIFTFFAHIRTPITNSTFQLFLGGNPRRRFYLWWIFWKFQFSHLQTYLFLWYLQLVNDKSRTEKCKIWDCSNSSARYTLSIICNHVIKKNLWLKIALQICFPTYHYCIVHNSLLITHTKITMSDEVPVPVAKELSEEEIVIVERPLHFMKNSS